MVIAVSSSCTTRNSCSSCEICDNSCKTCDGGNSGLCKNINFYFIFKIIIYFNNIKLNFRMFKL